MLVSPPAPTAVASLTSLPVPSSNSSFQHPPFLLQPDPRDALEQSFLVADSLGARVSQQQAQELTAKAAALREKKRQIAAGEEDPGSGSGSTVEGEEAGLRNPWGWGCGTTATVVVVAGSELICANAGDSRAVLCRAGAAEALSTDHKPSLVRPSPPCTRSVAARFRTVPHIVADITSESTKATASLLLTARTPG